MLCIPTWFYAHFLFISCVFGKPAQLKRRFCIENNTIFQNLGDSWQILMHKVSPFRKMLLAPEQRTLFRHFVSVHRRETGIREQKSILLHSTGMHNIVFWPLEILPEDEQCTDSKWRTVIVVLGWIWSETLQNATTKSLLRRQYLVSVNPICNILKWNW